MKRVPLLVLATFALACNEPAATTQPCEATTTDAAPGTAAAGTATLDATIRKTASSAPQVERMKIRVDDSGVIVKQSVYHGDASVIPAAVRELAEKTFPEARALKYETEVYADIGLVFEIELETKDGKLCEVSSQPDGTLVYTECHIDPRELPEPVAARAEATIAGGKIIEAEQKTGPKVDEFTVEVEHEGREFYLRVRPDGTLIAKLVRVPAIIELPIP
jgi:hypothetical protein